MASISFIDMVKHFYAKQNSLIYRSDENLYTLYCQGQIYDNNDNAKYSRVLVIRISQNNKAVIFAK